MGNFYREDRPRGKSNNRNQGGGGVWREKQSFGNRDNDGPEMHQTTCSECGMRCEVPFKPNGSKPVFCRSCFNKDEFEDSGSDRRRFEKPSFKKSFDKPYRENSFEKPRHTPAPQASYKTDFEMLNAKLDMVLKRMDQMNVTKPTTTEAPTVTKPAKAPAKVKVVAEIVEKKKKPAAKKATSKK